MVVERVEQGEVQDRWHRAVLIVAHSSPADAVRVGHRPAIGTGDHAHPVGAKAEEFARHAVEGDGFEIGVP